MRPRIGALKKAQNAYKDMPKAINVPGWREKEKLNIFPDHTVRL